ncbi:MAG: nicotinate (nicotinamide) nucleotide adenylyltransferase [Spirochaetaceae bacterium]|nr:nicotinate (nicotinamide) nucleotide adenylyltransferase [Spirochaetaceae bacterium]
MKIALLGGTFNPIHNGHMSLASEVKNKFHYDLILFIPSYIPAHKNVSAVISAEERLHMLKLAIDNIEWADYSDCEIQRKGISYTIETLKYIEERFSLSELPGLIIGDDLARGFNSWRNPEKIISMTNIIIAHRLYTEELDLPFAHKYIDNDIFSLSSSEIREMIHSGKDISEVVPAQVADYIREREFYKNETGCN